MGIKIRTVLPTEWLSICKRSRGLRRSCQCSVWEKVTQVWLISLSVTLFCLTAVFCFSSQRRVLDSSAWPAFPTSFLTLKGIRLPLLLLFSRSTTKLLPQQFWPSAHQNLPGNFINTPQFHAQSFCLNVKAFQWVNESQSRSLCWPPHHNPTHSSSYCAQKCGSQSSPNH